MTAYDDGAADRGIRSPLGVLLLADLVESPPRSDRSDLLMNGCGLSQDRKELQAGAFGAVLVAPKPLSRPRSPRTAAMVRPFS
jgi:hypothetical protein